MQQLLLYNSDQQAASCYEKQQASELIPATTPMQQQLLGIFAC
jgi:hypothetical protein